MSMSVSLKKATNKTNIKHNNRNMNDKDKERNSHIDESRSHENIYLVQKNLKEVYQEEFGEALENYNAKQKRNDRKIDNYYEHIQSSKKTSLQQELIIQVGDKEDFSSKADFDKANEILKEWYSDFEKRNPQLKIYNAVIHNDEASPHMHVNFVPVAEGYKRGLEKQVSFDKAITQQDLTLDKVRPFEHWREKEVQFLEKSLQERGIERKLVGTNDYKDVNEYKEKKDLEREIKQLEGDLSQRKTELKALTEKVSSEIKVPFKKQMEIVDVPSGEKNFLGKEKMKKEKQPTGNVVLTKEDYKKLATAANQKEKLTQQIFKVLDTDFAKENKELKAENKVIFKEWKSAVEENSQLRDENSRLKQRVGSLTNEIENLYKHTKEYFKERTGDLNAFKKVFGSWIDKIKEKLPTSHLKRVHDRSEAKENTFSMENVAELDKQVRSQKSAKRKNMDLER
ncbi:plasmid recombination protein (plasmid) [Sporosarcina psychrophila]|uniref:plasmid recombination protein n=1 Tax=Sporosarcina psychrophila TaxID=1476 RepID=UPI0030D062BB